MVDFAISLSYASVMNLDKAASALGAMGNRTRLQIVRLLVRAGDQGLPVGSIQKELKIPSSTLTHHLSYLRGAGLIRQDRQGTNLYCKMEYRQLDTLWKFLTKQCCIDMVQRRAKKVA
jgi:DNA-binding transcriptional ArsR family regulator